MHNTGNPLPSKDILDLYDNSETIDNFVNSQQDEVPDRFGTKRLTLAGLTKRSMALRNEINDFSGALTFKPEWSDVPMNVSEGVGGEGGALNLQAEALGNRSEINKVTSREALRRSYAEAGYNLVDGSFDDGGTVITATDVLLYASQGKAYRWSGALAKVVLPNSTPETTGGISPSGDWVDVGDASAYSRITNELLAGCLVNRSGKFALRDIVSVVDFGAAGGSTDDTAAFQNAISAGGGTAFVPYNPNGYTVNAHVYGLVGYGATKFKGTGLVSYTDLSKSNGEYLTCANIAKLLSDGQNLTLACVGDSTMYGYLVGGATAQTQDPNNPPISLKRTLSHVYGGYTGTVINAAVSGSNMDDLMKTVPSFESRISTGDLSTASVIYCNMAINNCQSNLSIDEFKQNYFDFVSIVRRYGKVPVIVTPNPINPLFGGDPRESTQIDMYAQVMRDVASATGCDLVDNHYWTKQTAKRYAETVLVPDGIHPSTDLYKQLGRNLAIPLVSANTLRKAGDIASISGSSYLDTQSSAILRQDQTRTGLGYNAQRSATQTGINCAVIFNEPFEYISFMGLQWENGARMQVGVQDNTAPWGFPRCGKSYGQIGIYKWDTDFVVETDAMAGLNILYWLFDTTDTRPTNNAAVLSGFAVPVSEDRNGIVPSVITPEFISKNSASSTDIITTVHSFVIGGGGLSYYDINSIPTCRIYLHTDSNMMVDLVSDFGVVSSSVIAGAEPAGEKVVSLSVREDEITVKLSRTDTGVSVTSPISLTNALPPIHLATIGKTFSITKQ